MKFLANYSRGTLQSVWDALIAHDRVTRWVPHQQLSAVHARMARFGKWVESRSDEPVGRVAERTWRRGSIACGTSCDSRLKSPTTSKMFINCASHPPRRGGHEHLRLLAAQASGCQDAQTTQTDSQRGGPSTIWTFWASGSASSRANCRRVTSRPLAASFANAVKKPNYRSVARTKSSSANASYTRARGSLSACMASRMANSLAARPRSRWQSWQAFLHAGNQELSDAHALHAFRIEGKRVRYAMEIFVGAFPAEFRQTLYPLVASLQEKLGEINDHVTAEAYLTEWRQRFAGHAIAEALDALWQLEHERLEVARREFLAWWTPDRRASEGGV